MKRVRDSTFTRFCFDKSLNNTTIAVVGLCFSKKIDTMKLISVDKGVVSYLLQRKSKLGKRISEILVGEKLHVTETIEDKDYCYI